jgi:thioredoxin reductase (NADPH)
MAYKVIIIGSGPAGLTAGIYAARAKLEPLIFEGFQPGGQLTTTTKVENWPGIIEVIGPKLMMDMRKQAIHCGCKMLMEAIAKVDFSKRPFKIFTQSGKEFEAESVIIATGASHKKLNIPGEKEYWSKGVSVCATCDAPFFQDKHVVIAGGGNSAIAEGSHLLNYVKKLTIVHLLDQLTATDPLKDKVLANPKVEVIYHATIAKINGDGQKVTELIVEDQKTKQQQALRADGVFIAVGMKPNSEVFAGQLELDKWGYILKKQNTQTSKQGVFVAGDVADFRYRQAITASGMGCMAALDCQEFLEGK